MSGMRREDVQGWLDRYIAAWRANQRGPIEQLFTDVGAPGLAEQPDFLHTTLFADVDYRDQRGNPRSGGFYHVAVGRWDDRTLQKYDFKRLDVDLWQFVPLVSDKRHVLSGHLGASFVNNAAGDRVPFYFLPYVGGVDTIRSFHEFRFKDENAMWLTAEYSYMPIKWVSVAAFVDAGKVAPDWNDIDFTGLKKGYGFGVRVHSRTQTFARILFGTGGGEGLGGAVEREQFASVIDTFERLLVVAVLLGVEQAIGRKVGQRGRAQERHLGTGSSRDRGDLFVVGRDHDAVEAAARARRTRARL